VTSTPATTTAPAPRTASIEAYRGLGAWVDLYDAKAWRDPGAAVRNMAAHGVRTLYIETSNSGSAFALKDSWRLAVFIQEAHTRGMRIVAWYLPSLKRPERDYRRIAAAVAFRTPEGETFDGFALDIEASTVRSVTKRNHAVVALSQRIRALVGDTCPLGAITPSPSALAKKRGYWDRFPYRSLAAVYDVFLPMGYYTYHGHGPAAALVDTRANIRELRAQPGCSTMPIHLVGGLSGDSSTAEVRAFVRGSNEGGVQGASLYDWATTTRQQWHELGGLTWK